MSNPTGENIFKIIGNYLLSEHSDNSDKALTNKTARNKFYNKFKSPCRKYDIEKHFQNFYCWL